MTLRRIVISLSVIILAPCLESQAAEWKAEPVLSLKSGYNDNVLLVTGPHTSVWETNLIASSSFGVARENQGLIGDAGITIRRFSGGSGRESSDLLDREDYYLTLDGYHQSERNIFRGNIDYIRDSTQDSEVNETGAFTNVYATRIKKTAGVAWTGTLTQRMSLDTNYQYNDISFADDPGVIDLIPYTFDSLNARLNYQVTPRTVGILSSARNTFRPDTGINSDTINFQAGFNNAYSETVNISLLAGYRKTSTDTFFLTGFCLGADPGATFPECRGGIPIPTGTERGETKTSGSVYSASISKRLEKGAISAQISRSVTPDLNGRLLDTNQLRLNGFYRFTEMLEFTLPILYSENETVVNIFGRDANNAVIEELDKRKQKYFSIRPRLSWRFLNDWRLSGEYWYDKREDRQRNTASRNAAYLTLTFVPEKLSISR